MPDAFRLQPWAVRLLLACVLLTLGPSVAAENGRQKRVLALYVTTPGAAGAAAFDAVYQRVLGDALGLGLDFHSEYIDLARFSEPDYPVALAEFLRRKYRELSIDMVLAPTEGALRFAERFRADLFPGVPIVFIDRTPASSRSPDTTGIRAKLDLAATLDLALTLQPATKRVFVVSGKSTFDRFYEGLARAQLQRFAGRVELTFLSSSLAELTKTVAHLPPDSVIYFLTLAEDAAGARFLSTDAVDRLAAVANGPIYSWHNVGLNHGIVGGRLYSNEVVAERSAHLSLRILRGEKPDRIPVLAVDPYVTQLDWRQLQRWGISEARAPKDATILFREPSLWDRYKFYIVATLSIVGLQTALIASLLVQRARRRQVEVELQRSNTQIRDLFGRLLVAQEVERSRIARDLHDDVSQRIAGLSIMMSALKRRLRGQPDDTGVVTAVASLQETTIALAEDIRHVTHDLHPGVLQHAGLVAALRTYCEQFEQQYGIAVTYTADSDLGTVEADAALCLYRIAQETLRNVAKHADARHVGVTLSRAPDGLRMSIIDDGKGFDLAEAQRKGLGIGLISIDERVRQLRGCVRIETHPRGGTRVQIQIPVEAASA